MTKTVSFSSLIDGIEGLVPAPLGGLSQDRNVSISSLVFDSRKVSPGSLFFAISGSDVDGRRYLADARDRGAAGLIVDGVDLDPSVLEGVNLPTLIASDIRTVLSRVAARFYDSPTDSSLNIAVTGTNGKTSVTWILSEILARLGADVLHAGTLGIRRVRTVGGQVIAQNLSEAVTTTPDPISLFASMSSLSGEKKVLVEEVTSIGVAQRRTAGIDWDTALLTNVTHDHLDYHGSFEAYASFKKDLFLKDLASSSKERKRAVVWLDDAVGAELAGAFQRLGKDTGGGSEAELVSVSAREQDTTCLILSSELSFDGSKVTVRINGAEYAFESKLLGQFNVINIVLAVSCLCSLGYHPAEVAEALRQVPSVPGRLEWLPANGFVEKDDQSESWGVVIDYAHTPDALESVLRSLRQLCSGRIIALFGCGGDRDRRKRPLMAKAVAKGADLAVVTSDNPRTESPLAIIEETVSGLLECGWRKGEEFYAIEDRREAINFAVSLAEPGDIVLVAGKGHEAYQEINGVRTPFSDREVCEQAIQTKVL